MRIQAGRNTSLADISAGNEANSSEQLRQAGAISRDSSAKTAKYASFRRNINLHASTTYDRRKRPKALHNDEFRANLRTIQKEFRHWRAQQKPGQQPSISHFIDTHPKIKTYLERHYRGPLQGILASSVFTD